MGAGASSKSTSDVPSSGTSGKTALTRMSVLSVAQASKDSVIIQELEAQVRDLKAQISMQSSSALIRDPKSHHKLVEASLASLKRKDKKVMEEIFNCHATPLGLSAKALSSALLAIDPSSLSAELSDTDAAKKLSPEEKAKAVEEVATKKLKEVDDGSKGYANLKEFREAVRLSCAKVAESYPAIEDVFRKFTDVKGLSAEALKLALEKADAPVLLASEGCSPEQIFRGADANTSGWVDLAE